MPNYKKGDIVEAKIVKLETYGAFAKIDNNYGGLIHISEITDKFVNDVNDFLDIDDVVKVQILDDITDCNQLKLSIKSIEGNELKRKKRKIKETVFGFYLLEKQLPKWINKKMKEFDKKN